MKFYIVSVQHNAEKNAENRSVPKAFDDKFQAIQEFHRQIANDMANTTLDWGFVSMLNSNGYLETREKWERTVYFEEPVESEDENA